MSKNQILLAGIIALVFLTGSSALAAEIGTRENPVPMGQSVDFGDGWQITVLKVIPDATDIVLKENMFNKPPKAGDQFFLARVQAKHVGPNSATFDGIYRLRAVGPSSAGYSIFENPPGVIPDPLPESEVFSGGVITGNVGWEIRSSDANALIMYDNPVYNNENKNRIYLALYSSSKSTGGDINSDANELNNNPQPLLEGHNDAQNFNSQKLNEFDFGNYTVGVNYNLPTNKSSMIYANYTDSNISIRGVKWNGENKAPGEWTILLINEFKNNTFGELLKKFNTTDLILLGLKTTIEVEVEKLTDGDELTNETAFFGVNKPYFGVLASGNLRYSGSAINAYIAPLDNNTILIMISTENDSTFAQILRGLVVTRKKDIPSMRAVNLMQMLQ